MVVRKYKKGTGITAVEMEEATGEDLEPAIKRFFDAWNTAWHAGGECAYGARSLSAVQLMQRKLDEFGAGPHADDTEGDFAKRFLDRHENAVAALNRIAYATPGGRESAVFRDADQAARSAYQAGIEYALAAMKFAHEADALRGEKTVSAAREGAIAANAVREVQTENRYATINELRSDIQERRPALSQASLDLATVAALDKRGIKVSVSTVKRARLRSK